MVHKPPNAQTGKQLWNIHAKKATLLCQIGLSLTPSVMSLRRPILLRPAFFSLCLARDQRSLVFPLASDDSERVVSPPKPAPAERTRVFLSIREGEKCGKPFFPRLVCQLVILKNLPSFSFLEIFHRKAVAKKLDPLRFQKASSLNFVGISVSQIGKRSHVWFSRSAARTKRGVRGGPLPVHLLQLQLGQGEDHRGRPGLDFGNGKWPRESPPTSGDRKPPRSGCCGQQQNCDKSGAFEQSRYESRVTNDLLQIIDGFRSRIFPCSNKEQFEDFRTD